MALNRSYPMKSILLFLSCLTIARAKDELAHIDLAKLRDPATTAAVIEPLIVPDKDWRFTGYLLFEAPQPNGNQPLFIVGGTRDYISSYKTETEYSIEDESAIFGKEGAAVFARLEPSLERIHEHPIYVFDENGDEIRPFGGNNYISSGYLYDFDDDGILDRADSTNYGLEEAPKHKIEVFEVLSVEPEARTLLEVVFNWHPRSAKDANEWFFECFDENSDGIPEIAFGPKDQNQKIQHDIVFRWNAATKQYSAGDLPEKSHVRVLQKGETLKSIAAKGGLGYPLLEKQAKTPPQSAAREPYVFESLKGRPIDDFIAFFSGKSRRSAFDGVQGSFPNAFPEKFFSMQPKAAALALAEANRTSGHRENYRLAIDDLDGAASPSSGWAYYDWVSSGCYSLSRELYALQFGTPDPLLVVFGYNSIGVVGRNAYADQPANNARLIKLSEKETTFLTETTYWLDRIRSKRTSPDDDSRSAFGSSADGYGSFSFYPKNGKPTELASGTDWATSSISGNWSGDYDRTVFINLTGLLFKKGIPEMLGDRWENKEIERQSLMTPTADRLADRVGDDARQKLANDFSTILELNASNSLPPEAIARLCSAAGTEGLITLLPALEKLHASLPPLSAVDKEFARLQKRFARNHFGEPLADDPAQHKKAYARLKELRDKRKFELAANIRDSLETSIEKLRLATDSARLKQEFIDKGPLAQWALGLLRRTEPETWAALVAADFPKADRAGKRMIFATVAAGYPPAAAQLIANLKPGEKQSFIPEIIEFHQKHAPEKVSADIPALMTFAANRENDLYQRGDAMIALSKMDLTPPQLSEFTANLIGEIRNPQKGNYGSGSLGYALQTLATLPNPAQHLESIQNLPNLSKNAFSEGFFALEKMTTDNPDREKILATFLRTQFTKSAGDMNSHFTKALVYDLRSLTQEIAEFASASPDPEDGDGANYTGGNFSSPIGHRYHIAREITALWNENDPETLAQMWIAFVAAHPASFDPNRNSTAAARAIAEKHIRALPAAQREATRQQILKKLTDSTYYPATRTWLTSL